MAPGNLIANTSAVDLAPVLLTTGGYHGTLAAVRALGRAGIPVVVADAETLAVSSWSRFTHARQRAPELRDAQGRFLEWLLAFGETAQVRHVLLPTCDDSAWLYARHRDELSRYFHVSSCGIEPVYALLNKRRLMQACREVGIDTPETRSVGSERELAEIVDQLKLPLLIKPTTQVLFESREKGKIVHDRAALLETYHRFRKLAYLPALRAFDPSVTWPLLQEFIPGAEQNIYNLSGYVGGEGEPSVFRASVKVLQERQIGVGICFESAEVDAALSDAVSRLFRTLGYRGIFEIEFIRARDRYYLIDVNPRFYGEMAFEVARGMPLPLLAYFDALGDKDSVRALTLAAAESQGGPRAHTYRVGFEMFLRTRRLSGALNAEQERTWRNWWAAQGGQLSDAVHDADDWLPSLVETAKNVYRQLRYPAELVQQAARHRLRR